MKIWEWVKLWRTTKGYGVHSPLAFRLLKHVVRPEKDVIYYGEKALSLMTDDFRLLHKAKLILRFIAEIQPSYVWTSPLLPDIYMEAIRRAGCVVRIYDGAVFPSEAVASDMIVTDNFRFTKAEAKKLMTPGRSLIAFGLTYKSALNISDSLKAGIVLRGGTGIIAVNRKEGAPHRYEILPFEKK